MAGFYFPGIALVAGALLLIIIYPPHPRVDWPLIWHNPQQRQHTLMATAIMVAGAAELGGLRHVWSVAAVFIGVLFLTHTQHGPEHAMGRAILIHRILGITIIMAGLLRLGEAITDAGFFAFLWPLVALAAGVQLLLYREPSGAFEAQGVHGNHS